MGKTESVVSQNIPEFVPLPHQSPDWPKKMELISGNKIYEFSKLLPILRSFGDRGSLDFEGLEYSIRVYGEERFYDSILPFMFKNLKSTPEVFKDIRLPFLLQDNYGKVEIERKAACVLLTNAFFSTFSFFRDEDIINQKSKQNKWALNEVNFDGLHNCPGKYKPTNAKLCMILRYFDRCSMKEPEGTIVFERKCVDLLFEKEEEKKEEESESKPKRSDKFKTVAEILNPDELSKIPLSVVNVHPTGSLRDVRDGRQVDFANMFLGGGVLETGCVQEEIMFCSSPESILSMLLCPCLMKNECVVMYGTEQFSHHEGYGKVLTYAGDFDDSENVGLYEIVAMDAVDYRSNDDILQYKKVSIQREFAKSFVSFHGGNLSKISTGNWGCGAFRGDHRLKFMIQWVSASMCGKILEYYTFEGKHPILAFEIENFVKNAMENKKSVNDLFQAMMRLEEISANDDSFREQSMLELVEKILSGNM